MPRSKIIYGDEVLIDLTGDTVTADTLAEGVTAHDKAGNAITGTMQAASVEFGWFTYANKTTSPLPFVLGMTWGEWVESYLNVRIPDGGGMVHAYANGDYVSFTSGSGIGYHVSTDGTQAGRVTLEDLIINEFGYEEYMYHNPYEDF